MAGASWVYFGFGGNALSQCKNIPLRVKATVAKYLILPSLLEGTDVIPAWMQWRLLTERDKTHIPEPNPGILARKFLTSHREGGPKPEEANGGPKAQDCRSDDPRQIHKLAHKELSHSTKPISNWSINPLQPIRSPIDGVNRFPSYEMPPVSERGKTPGCYFFPEPALLTTHSNQILQ